VSSARTTLLHSSQAMSALLALTVPCITAATGFGLCGAAVLYAWCCLGCGCISCLLYVSSRRVCVGVVLGMVRRQGHMLRAVVLKAPQVVTTDWRWIASGVVLQDALTKVRCLFVCC
jgi:hypothetical protein